MNHIELAKECGLLGAQPGSHDYAARLEMFTLLVLISRIPKYPPLIQLFDEYQLSRVTQ